MNKTLIFPVFMLMLIVLAQPISAYTYLNIYVDSSGNAEFLGETNETNATLALPSGISIADGRVRGITKELTTKKGEVWTFSYSLRNAEIKVILPEGSSIESLDTGEISLERGRISVYFQDTNSLIYTISNVSSSNTYLIVTGIVILVFILFYFFRNKLSHLTKPKIVYKKQKAKENKISSIKHMLNERENLILEKLKQTGKIKMSHLRKLSDIPKASFSRHVQELEKKKLLARTGDGKNKFVEISK